MARLDGTVNGREQYVAGGDAASIPDGGMRTLYVEDLTIVLVNLGGEIYALDDKCPHQGGPLSRGTLKDNLLMCPWHCWQFDVKSGRPHWPEGIWRATRYPVKLEDGQIMVRIG
jgi:nitrite reductase/ring-hydroxylating ferredoxin subunit